MKKNTRKKTPSLDLVPSVESQSVSGPDKLRGFITVVASDDEDGEDLKLKMSEDPLLKVVESESIETRYAMLKFTQDSQLSQSEMGVVNPAIEKSNAKAKEPKRGRQLKIFDFAESVDNDDDEYDISYQVLSSIYAYFNKKIKIPAILMAIHQCGGDIERAVKCLAKMNYRFEGKPTFSYQNISAPREIMERYFRA